MIFFTHSKIINTIQRSIISTRNSTLFKSLSLRYIHLSTSLNSSMSTILADSASIEKPNTDNRSYRLIKLESNDLHVLLINVPGADKSAASLDVNVGSFADKEYGIPGLAHFCEHLLFMGTEKYPEENEYSRYLSHHSGHSNAYTSAEHTNYYFQVSSEYLEGALDRFSQFFISPLFSNSCKDREINAVDSENKKNLQNDMWRLYQLDKSKSNLEHPYNGFSTGNYQTLHVEPTSKDINVRDILLEFYKSHYSSNIMSLVILGKEDLDTLSSFAVEKFSTVPNKSFPRPNYDGKVIYNPENLTKLLKAKPIKDDHKLELSFMIPHDLDDKWSIKPDGYYSHLLGHESKGSILYYLKEKGWVTELSSGNMKVCQGNSLFILEFDLTPQGLDHWEEIVVTVFEYLKLIKENDPKQWIWNEISNISKVNFKFRQKTDASSTVSKMSNSLYKFIDGNIPPQYLLSSGISREFNSEEIKKYGEYLNPENFRISLVSQSLEGLNDKEKWYGTEHSYEDISQDLLAAIKSVQHNSNLHYPIPNEFIPENFDILKPKSESPLLNPYLIEDTEKIQVWFKQDDRFEIPKATIEMVIHLPSSNVDVISSTYSALISELIEDDLNQITYYASLVGLKVNINSWRQGFNIEVYGYNDKLPELAEVVLKKFMNFKPSKERFEAIKFKLSQNLKNFGYNLGYNQIGTHFLLLVNDKTYTHEEKLKVLQDISFNDVYEFSTKKIWEQGIFVETLVHGNYDISKTREISQFISKHIKEIKLIEDVSSIRLQNYVLQPKETIRYELALKDTENINSCIEYYFQISPNGDDTKLRVLTDLLGTIIREPSFNQLRTKEQLGYVVFSGVKLGRTSLGFRVLVQSERSTDYLEYRIDEFLTKFGRYVSSSLTDGDFLKFKQALKDLKLTKLKHLKEETSRFFNSISDGYYDFEGRLKQVEILESITKQEFIKFYSDYISKESEKSARLVVHLKSQCVPTPAESKLVQSAIINFLYRNDLEISSDKLDTIIEANSENYQELVNEVVKELEASEPDILTKDLLAAIENGVKDPVPSQYPSGELVSNISDFRAHHKLGGIPHPVKPLSSYYYPENDSHL